MKKRNLVFALCLFSLSAVAANDPVSQPEVPEDIADLHRATGQQPRARNWGRPAFPKIAKGSHNLQKTRVKRISIAGFKGGDISSKTIEGPLENNLIDAGIYDDLGGAINHAKRFGGIQIQEEPDPYTDEQERHRGYRKTLIKHLKRNARNIHTLRLDYQNSEPLAGRIREDIHHEDKLMGDIFKASLLPRMHRLNNLEVFLPASMPLKTVFNPLKRMTAPPMILEISGGELSKQDVPSLTSFFRRLKARPQKGRRYTFFDVKFKDQESFLKMASVMTQGQISILSLQSCDLEKVGNLSPLFQSSALEELHLLQVSLPKALEGNNPLAINPSVTLSQETPSKLKKLSLSACMHPIKGLSSLEVLSLVQEEDQTMDESLLRGWLEHKKLKKFSLEGGYLEIESSKRLTQNFFSFFNAQFPQGGALHLNYVGISTPRAFQNLGVLICNSKITELKLKECTFPLSPLTFLYVKNNLKKLVLFNNDVQREGYKEETKDASRNTPKGHSLAPKAALTSSYRGNQSLEEVHYSASEDSEKLLKEAGDFARWAAGHKPLKTLVLKLDPKCLSSFYEALKACPRGDLPLLSSLTISPHVRLEDLNVEKEFEPLKEKVNHFFFPSKTLENAELVPSTQAVLPVPEEAPSRLHKALPL